MLEDCFLYLGARHSLSQLFSVLSTVTVVNDNSLSLLGQSKHTEGLFQGLFLKKQSQFIAYSHKSRRSVCSGSAYA